MTEKFTWQNFNEIDAHDTPEDVDTESLREQKRQRYEQNTHVRRTLTIWVMAVVSLWLIFVATTMVLCGCGRFHLSNNVLTALLVTTTANILGLAYIVLKGMFPFNSRD